ncbi:MAG: ankyrin repeat domain-containing protein [Acidobacteriota bacterium]|jgi:ankyrin repeat protein
MRIRAVVAILLLSAPAAFAAVPATSDAPVADAAMHRDLDAVRALLRHGADVNAPQNDGMTALHWAALEDDADLAGMLVYAGAWLDVGTRLGGYTPLHLAARSGSLAAMQALLEAGADPQARTTSGGAQPLHLAAAADSVGAIDLLIDAGADVDGREDAWEQTPLMFAAAAGNVDAVRALLAAGADVSASAKVVDVVAWEKMDRDETRRRARVQQALRAVEEEDEEKAAEEENTGEEKPAEAAEEGEAAGGEQAAEAAGAEEKAASAEQEQAAAQEEVAAPMEVVDPATEEAAVDEEGTSEEAESEANAGEATEEADKKDEEPERPPTYGELVGGHGGLTALLYAAREGQVETVDVLLDGGADIGQPSGGDHTSPLLIATLNGHFDLAMELLERGADPNLASDAGATPLYGALNVRWAPRSAYPQQNAYKQQRTGYLELMTALLEAGADPDVRLEKHLWYTSFNFDHLVDSTGATPFWRAAYATDVEAMKLLVSYGADPNIPTRKLPSRGRPRPQGEDGKDKEEGDPSGLPEVPVGGPAVWPLLAAAGAGYGENFAGYAHQHVPDGWMPAVRYLVEELGADVHARDHNGYNAVHHAAARGDFEMILYLVSHGADPTAVSRKGQTTADMANGPVQRVQPFPQAMWLLEHLGSKNNHNCVSC